MTAHNPNNGLILGMLVLMFLLILGLLVLAFDGWLALEAADRQQVRTSAEGEQVLVLRADRSGHYTAYGTINGQPVHFLVDTGASRVVVPAHLGTALGLKAGAPSQAMTAAGVIDVYDTVADQVRIGPIELRTVPALLNPAMEADFVLLGMSFMRDLEMIQRDGELILRVGG